MIIERVLRAAAIVIAILGLVDPVLTLPWSERPIVSVTIVEPDTRETSALMQGTLTPGDANALKARVIAALEGEFDVRDGSIADAAAIVLIGDGRSPSPASAATSASTSPPPSTSTPASSASPTLPGANSAESSSSPVVAAVVPSPAARATRIVRIDAPRRAHISEAVPVTVQVEARGLAGRTSAIVAHADGLEVARTTHKWPAGASAEQATVHLAIPSLHTGPSLLAISVIDDIEDSTNAGAAKDASKSGAATTNATADIAVDVHDRPLRVLFVNGRPSWATRFIERALDDDPRFSVSSATRVSRNVTATSATAPASLGASDPDTFQAIVIGAPELLTNAEAATLRTFVRVRGGLLIVAPDRMPEGPVLDLLPARKFTERLLEEPVALAPMFASEFALPDALLPGADVLLRLDATASGPPVIAGSPLGEGYTIVSGALDAWRYRDRAKDGFDRFWRDTISARAAAVPDPVEITLDPAVAAPDDPISVHVRVRAGITSGLSTAATAATATTTAAVIAARLTRTSTADGRNGAGPSTEAAPDRASTPIRLWPDARPSAYHGAINAPSQDGVYAVSVQLDGQAAPVRAHFRVQHGARIARPAWPGLQAFVEARRGLLVTSDQLDRLSRHLRESIRPAKTRPARHPLRSAWWILPFAACLGGEWLLRRRRGER